MMIGFANPDHLAFNFWIPVEKSPCNRRGQAKINRVAAVIACDAQPQIHPIFSGASLNRLIALNHAATELLGTSPKYRRQTAFARDTAGSRAERCVRQ